MGYSGGTPSSAADQGVLLGAAACGISISLQWEVLPMLSLLEMCHFHQYLLKLLDLTCFWYNYG